MDIIFPEIVSLNESSFSTINYIGPNSDKIVIFTNDIKDGIRISLATIGDENINFEDNDIFEINLIGVGNEPMESGYIEIANAKVFYSDSTEGEEVNTYPGNVTVYNPQLLGDFSDENIQKDDKVDINDFLIFVKHYGSKQGESLYASQCDISSKTNPAIIAPVADWEDEKIYSIPSKDGEINIYDFIIFARNYNKRVPRKNSFPEFPESPSVTPTDNSLGLSVDSVDIEFPEADDEDNDPLTYTVYFGKNGEELDNSKIIYTGGSTKTSVTNLERGQTYIWRVKVSDGNGGEDWLPSKDGTYKFSTQSLDTLFAAGGYEGVFVLDISDTKGPTVTNYLDTEGYVFDVAKFSKGTKDYIAIADGKDGVKVYEYTSSSSDLTNPSLTYYLGSDAVKIKYNANYLYVAAKNSGAFIMEFDDVNKELKEVSNISGIGEVYDIFVSDNTLYVAGNNGLYTVDISDKSNPSNLGSLSLSGAKSLFVDGNYAYVAAGFNGIYKIDVSDPNNLSEVSNSSYYADSLYVKDDYLYVASGVNGVLKLSKDTLSIVDTYNENIFRAVNVIIDGGTAYIANDRYGLIVLDTSNMEKLDEYDIGSFARDVDILNNQFIIIADSEKGIKVYDADTNLTSISDATLTKSLEIEGIARSVYTDDTISSTAVFVASGNKGFNIIEVDNTGNATKINTIPIFGEAYSMIATETTSSTLLYVASGSGGINIYKINDLDSPEFINNYSTDGIVVELSFIDSSTSGTTLVLAESDRVSVYDVDTSNATKLDSYEINDGNVTDVTVDGTTIYVAAGSKGLYVLGLDSDSNDATLTKLGSSRFDNAFILKVEKRASNVLELATYNEGIIMMNIGNPNSLGDADSRDVGSDNDGDGNYILSQYDTQGLAYSVKYSNNYSLVADGQNGLVILSDSSYNLELEKDYNWINFESFATN
jgi:hypothetical protein